MNISIGSVKAKKFFVIIPFLAALALTAIPWDTLRLTFPAQIQDILTIFTGIMLEALPFVLLGVLVSGLIRRFISPERMAKLIPKNPLIAFPAVALLGLLFPVCECGNLPVARQLMRQGMRPSQAITFLLAAPIINPAVIISTVAAFSFMPRLIVARIAVGFIIAMLVGAYFYIRGDTDLLKPEAENESCEHTHSDLTGLVDEFFEMYGTLAIGALIAGIIQILVPRSFLLGLASTPIASIAVMMALALVVSLCSNVDAFFALSFAATFSASSLLAFLVFGPMVDFRSLALMTRSFKPRTILTIALLVAQFVFVAALILHNTNLV